MIDNQKDIILFDSKKLGHQRCLVNTDKYLSKILNS